MLGKGLGEWTSGAQVGGSTAGSGRCNTDGPGCRTRANVAGLTEDPSIAPVSQRGRKRRCCGWRGERAERGREGMKEMCLGSPPGSV